MNQGFYKLEENILLYSDGSLYNKNYELHQNLKDTYDYPIDGWYWFSSLEDACNYYKLDINNYRDMEDNNEL